MSVLHSSAGGRRAAVVRGRSNGARAEGAAAARARAARPPSDATSAADEAGADAPPIGGNLRRLRVKRGLSLDRLAQRSGVSRAMLSQIELGQSTPTINVLWKVARALDVAFSALITTRAPGGPLVLRALGAKRLTNADGSYTSRALFSIDEPRRVEFYELGLRAGTEEQAPPHPPGTSENLVVNRGALEVGVDGATYRLESGDALVFKADVPHHYRNNGPVDALIYLVMTYPDRVG